MSTKKKTATKRRKKGELHTITIKPTPLAYAFVDRKPTSLRELKRCVQPLETKELTVQWTWEGPRRWTWSLNGVAQPNNLWLLYEDEAHVRTAVLGPAFAGWDFPIRKRKAKSA